MVSPSVDPVHPKVSELHMCQFNLTVISVNKNRHAQKECLIYFTQMTAEVINFRGAFGIKIERNPIFWHICAI